MEFGKLERPEFSLKNIQNYRFSSHSLVVASVVSAPPCHSSHFERTVILSERTNGSDVVINDLFIPKNPPNVANPSLGIDKVKIFLHFQLIMEFMLILVHFDR